MNGLVLGWHFTLTHMSRYMVWCFRHGPIHMCSQWTAAGVYIPSLLLCCLNMWSLAFIRAS